MKRIFPVLLLSVLVSLSLRAQEVITELGSNPSLIYADKDARLEEALQTPLQKQASIILPFRDDFYYAYKSKYALNSLWEDSLVYVNGGFARTPPSFGVATFDGLDRHGYPYFNPPLPNLTASGPADTLTSKPINLFKGPISQTLQPSDNVGLSFYYQARGWGENPEGIDSLILDLYKPAQNVWNNRVWASQGNVNPNTNDSAFKRTFIWLRDTSYLHDGFRFRFRNKATNTGNFDHWHLDYVYLNLHRDSIADTLYDDVTFAYVPTPFLREYAAMPYMQYNVNEMAGSNSVWLKNNYFKPTNIYYENRVYDYTGAQVGFYTAQGDNIAPFASAGYFNNPAFSNPASQPTFTYDFPPLQQAQTFKIKHIVYRSGSQSDFWVNNDTVVQLHRFHNYYAYDDGTPEQGWYINGASGKMVVRVRLNVPDTLEAVRIYFDPAPIKDSEKSKFKIMVQSSNNFPSGLILLTDSSYNPVFYKNGFKEVPEYKLKTPLPLPAGEYFIGIQQQISTGIVIGLDKNYDSHLHLFYDSGSGWTQSGVKGSLMINPMFGAHYDEPVGVKEYAKADAGRFDVYPNPGSGRIFIRDNSSGECQFQLANALGEKIMEAPLQSEQTIIEAEHLNSGLYILSITAKGQLLRQQKIIIQK
jgi:hypothetical protein